MKTRASLKYSVIYFNINKYGLFSTSRAIFENDFVISYPGAPNKHHHLPLLFNLSRPYYAYFVNYFNMANEFKHS